MASPNWIDAVYDGGLDYIETNATRVDVCTTEPTTYAEATSTYTVANYTLDGSDWTISAGDVSGRKQTMGQQTGNNGTGTRRQLLGVHRRIICALRGDRRRRVDRQLG